MNNSVAPCNFQSTNSLTNQKNLIGPDQELVELLWQNGQVVLHSQTHRKPALNSVDLRQVQNNDQSTLAYGSHGNSSNLFQEDETVSWIQYPLEDPLEQELCSNMFPDLPSCEVEPDKAIKQFQDEKFAKFNAYSAPHVAAGVQQLSENPMPSPRFQFPDSSQRIIDFSKSQNVLNYYHFSAIPNIASTSSNAQLGGKGTSNMSQKEAKESSVVTVGSSHCGSNQIPRDGDVSRISSNGIWNTSMSAEPEHFREDVQGAIPKGEKGKLETHEPTVTSSSGGSGSSLEKTCSQSTQISSQKRKGTDIEELEEQSEAIEPKPASQKKEALRKGTSRKNRAAEVHNLSERRRRDRINERMRTLQQLIPHSNKTDKASMLDEAIEYLKSLQFQLQVLWMGGGMTPVMFPGIQHYMSQMGMGMASSSLPPIHNHMSIPRIPFEQSLSMAQTPSQTVTFQPPVLGPFNYQNQMQNPALSEQYARCMGYHLMQSASQPMNAFRYGSQAVQHSQTMIAPSSSNGPPSGVAKTNDSVGGKMG